MYREPLDSYSQWNQTICLFKLRQKNIHKLQHNTQKHVAGYADSRQRWSIKVKAALQVAPAQAFDRGLRKSRMCGSVRNRAQEEDLLASAMQTWAHLTWVFKSYFLDSNLDYGSCNASSLGSAALPVPSTHLLTSGGRKAPVWTAPSEAPHACRQTRSHLYISEQAFLL